VTATGSGRTISDCMRADLPWFVIGREWPEAADHTIRGLEYHPAWVRLTYQQRARTTWYWEYPETEEGGALKCKGAGWTSPTSTACDEWPWLKTEQGGANAIPLPHLKIINGLQNSVSGNRYGRFVTACDLPARKASSLPVHGLGNFLVIPVPEGSDFPSLNLCHGTNP